MIFIIIPVKHQTDVFSKAKYKNHRLNIKFIMDYEPTGEGCKITLTNGKEYLTSIEADTLDKFLDEFGEFYDLEAVEEIAEAPRLVYEYEEEEETEQEEEEPGSDANSDEMIGDIETQL